MNDSQQLREQMWDLIYGLLSPDETQPLIARIKSDPQAARLYAEVRLQADLVGYAAKIEDPSLNFQIEPAGGKTLLPTPARRSPAPRRAARRIPARSVLIGLAATALAGLLAVGIFWPQFDARGLAFNHLVTEVEGPQSMREGISTKITVKTTYPVSYGDALADEQAAATPADVEVQLVNSANEVRYRRLVRTSAEDGRAEVELPGEAIEPGVRLKVAAARQFSEAETQPAPDANNAAQQADRSGELAGQPSANVLTAALQVIPEPVDSYVVLESPPLSSNPEVNFYAFNYKPFSGKLVPADPAQITLYNADGASIAEPMWSVDPTNGVVRGSVQLPPNLPSQDLTVRLRENSGAEAQVQLGQLLDEKKLLADNGARGYRRGGAAVDNAPAQYAPSEPMRQLQQQERLESKSGDLKAAGDQPSGGAVPRSYEQGLDRGETLKEFAYDGRAADGKGFLAEGADQPLASGSIVSVPIPAEVTGKLNDLVAVAFCRGMNVASASAEQKEDLAKDIDRAESQSARSISLELPPEADGEIEIALIDRSATPPRVIDRRVVYREPTRKLNIALADGQQQLAAGQPARLTFQVTDEKGEPAAGANVFVRLWNENAIQQSAEPPVSLDDVARGRGRGLGVRKQEALYSGEQVAGMDSAPAAAGSTLSRDKAALENESRLGTASSRGQAEGKAAEGATDSAQEQLRRPSDALAHDFTARHFFADAGWGYEALVPTTTVTLASTREEAEAAYAAAIRAAQDERRAIVRAIFLVVLGGAVLLLAILAVLGLKRMPARRRLLIPTVAIAAASLVIGLVWFGQPPGMPRVAIAPTTPPPPGRAGAIAPGEEPPPAAKSPALATAEGGAVPESLSQFGNAPAEPQGETAAGAAPATTGSAAPVVDPAGIPLAATPPAAAAPATAPAPTPLPGVPDESMTRKSQPAGDVAASGPPALPLAAPAGPSPPARKSSRAAGGDDGQSAADRKSGQRDGPPANQAAPSAPATDSAGGDVAKRNADKLDAVAESLTTKKEAADGDAGANYGAAIDPTAKGKGAPSQGTPGEAGRPFSSPAAGFGGGQGAGGFGIAGESAVPADGGAPGPANRFFIAPGGKASGAPASGSSTLRGGDSRSPGAAGLPPLAAGSGLADAENRSKGSEGPSAPAVLYANPQLVTDASGRVTIEFTMPPGETAYRLLVDALGKGRIGSKQETIVGTSGPK